MDSDVVDRSLDLGHPSIRSETINLEPKPKAALHPLGRAYSRALFLCAPLVHCNAVMAKGIGGRRV